MELSTIFAGGTILSIVSRGIFLLIDQKVQVSKEVKQGIFGLVCIVVAYLLKSQINASLLEVAAMLFASGTAAHAAIKITSVSGAGKEELKKYEGYSSTAYDDGAGNQTIGYGNTYYPDGTKVKDGDSITKEKAEQNFNVILQKFSDEVATLITSDVSQCQFDALCSLAYNIGTNRFENSTLLKRVNLNPNDKEGITQAFMMWNKVTDPKTKKLIVSQGLINRRQKEIDLYFSGK